MDQLSYLIGQEEAALRQFAAALLDEQNILKSADPQALDGLQAVVARKNKIIETLARHGQQREALLQRAKYSVDRDGLMAWAKGCGRQDMMTAFLAVVDEANELNRLNGQLIAMRLSSTQAALATLVANRSNAQGLYGPKGQTRFSTGYRLIDTV